MLNGENSGIKEFILSVRNVKSSIYEVARVDERLKAMFQSLQKGVFINVASSKNRRKSRERRLKFR